MIPAPIHSFAVFVLALLTLACGLGSARLQAEDPAAAARRDSASPTGQVRIEGDLLQWHNVVLSAVGPFANERDIAPNPFTDYRMDVVFTHVSGGRIYRVPGYFAADGEASETGADSGNTWRAHLSPDRPGRWTYEITFVQGPGVATADGSAAVGTPVPMLDRARGSFVVAPTNKAGRDFRARGRLEDVGRHHLRFAGTGEPFFKAGPDSPETLLGTADFDGTVGRKPGVPLKTWKVHEQDARPTDPTWRGDRGRGLLGALNYLADAGLNTLSFLTYNAGGDGDNVWPFVDRNNKLHYDSSKLDQWGRVFAHAEQLGLHLHLKMQETENDDWRLGVLHRQRIAPEAFDGGLLGPERKLYLREMVARFGHLLALTWNIGEENSQTTEEQTAMAEWLRAIDAYAHPISLHTYPLEQDSVYGALLGQRTWLSGPSMQIDWHLSHERTLHWVDTSRAAGRPWVVSHDEQNFHKWGVPPDPGYEEFASRVVPEAEEEGPEYTGHDIRRSVLWGNFMAGGAGVEYYFGYKLPQNDLKCEDFRSRSRAWSDCRVLLEFLGDHAIPFDRMRNRNALVRVTSGASRGTCLVEDSLLYLVHLPTGGEATLDLGGVEGRFTVSWFDPRTGGALQNGSVVHVEAGGEVGLGAPPSEPGEDWLVIVRRTPAVASRVHEVVHPPGETVHLESGGLLVIEAEDYALQTRTEVRAWHRQNVPGAVGGYSLQVLPDTRVTHADTLIQNENFSGDPGRVAVVSYRARFAMPGRYYVWVRALSVGTEDNGVHVGLNHAWPESGRRMQWCMGKGTWRWESKQRTARKHCGEPHLVYLDVPEAGDHLVSFAMREDGFHFDRFMLTLDRLASRPEDGGPPASPTTRG